MKTEKIGRHIIDLDQVYYLTYAGGTRDLPAKDMKEYKKILSLPWGEARQKELIKLPKEKNPNVVPLTGRELMKFIRELNFVPLFDQYFEYTHMLKLTDRIIYEAIKTKQYSIAMRD